MQADLILRTKRIPYIVFGILLFPLATTFFILAALEGDIEGMKATFFLYGMLAVLYVFLLSFKVVVVGDNLSVRNFYIWHHIRLSDIERAYIQTSMKTGTGGEMMTFRIWIEPRKELGRKGFYIPLVNYKPEELQELYRVLGINSKRTRMFSRAKAG